MSNSTATSHSKLSPAGVFLAGAGFVLLMSGMMSFAVHKTWFDPKVALFLIFGAAALATGALFQARVAGAFAVPVGLAALILPHLLPELPFTSAGGMLATAAGLALVGQGAIIHRVAIKKLFATRRGRSSLWMGLNVVLVLYLLVMTNLISARHYSRLDLTGSHLFELSSKTKQIIGGIKGRVTIISLLAGGDPRTVATYKHVLELLKEYEMIGGGKIVVRKVPVQDEEAMTALRMELKQPPLANTLVILHGEGDEARERRIMGGQLVESAKVPSGQEVGPVRVKAEDVITSAIISVIENEKQHVFFVAGHGELDPLLKDAPGASKALYSLVRDNYTVGKIDLADNKSVPDDCAVLIIAGPKSKYSKHEIGLIRDYLDNRGRVLAMLDPVVKGWEPSGLEALFAEWGIKPRTDALVVRPRTNAREALTFATINYPAEDVGDPIVTPLHNMRTFFEIASPLQAVDAAKSRVELATLVAAEGKAWGETNFVKLPWLPDESDIKGPVALVMSAREKDPKPKQTGPLARTAPEQYNGARLVVFGDSDVIVNRKMGVANETLFINSVNWLAQQESKLGIQPKTIRIGSINYTAAQEQMINLFAVLGMPGIALVAGFIVHLLRQN